jgi:hypothetical protein
MKSKILFFILLLSSAHVYADASFPHWQGLQVDPIQSGYKPCAIGNTTGLVNGVFAMGGIASANSVPYHKPCVDSNCEIIGLICNGVQVECATSQAPHIWQLRTFGPGVTLQVERNPLGGGFQCLRVKAYPNGSELN